MLVLSDTTVFAIYGDTNCKLLLILQHLLNSIRDGFALFKLNF